MLLHALQPSLNGGEIDPALWHRTDFSKFLTWLKKDVNFLPEVQGGVSNRPGTQKQAAAKTDNVRLLTFEFSADENNAYVLEFGAGYIRFFTPAGLVLDEEGRPYEVETPFAAEDLPRLCKWQIGDVIYIAWGGKPKMLTRYGHRDWRLTDYVSENGPFDVANMDENKHVAVGYDVSKQMFTAYADTALFTTADAGRLLRVKNTFEAAHISASVTSADAYDSGHFFASGMYTFQTSGTWSGKAKIEYSKDLVNWKTEREFVSLNSKNFNFDGQLEEGFWWVRVTAEVTGGELALSYDAQTFDGYLTFEIMERVSPSKVLMKSRDGLVNLEELLDRSGELSYNLIPPMTANDAPAGNAYSDNLGDEAWMLFNEAHTDLMVGASPYTCGYRFEAKQYVNRVQIRCAWKAMLSNTRYPGSAEDFFHTFNLFYSVDSGEKQKAAWSAYVSDQGDITFDLGRYVLLDELYIEFQAKNVSLGSVLGYARVGNIRAAGYPYRDDERPRTLETDFAFGLWGGARAEYPTVVKAMQQRLIWFTGQRMDLSKIGKYNDFGVSDPLTDDDAISVNFLDDKISRVSAAAVGARLVVFTNGSNHVHSQTTLTPAAATFSNDFGEGAGPVDPVRTRGSILYASPLRESVSDFGYDYQRDGYIGNDITLLARHLFRNKKIKEMAWQAEPAGRLWVVQETGELLCCTYLREQDVLAWVRIETAGKVLSAAVLSDGTYENLYLAVKRKTGTFIEKMVTRLLSDDPKEQFFVDCGASYRGEPATEIAGLEYLEGCEVAVLADGNEAARQTVRNGKILLQTPAAVVHVGLPYTAELETLPGELGLGDGTAADRRKRIVGADVFFQSSRGGEMGTSGCVLDPILNAPAAYNGAAELMTRTVTQSLQGNCEKSPGLIIRQASPLPMSVTGFVPRIAVGG